MDRLVLLLSKADFEPIPATNDDAAVTAIESQPLAAVVIDGGIPPVSRTRLSEACAAHKPDIPIIEHFGAPQTLVGEVKRALGMPEE